ncbi:MAG: hypothetical protein WCV99_08825 [Sterolibacterium sp.]|jgi:hypothetical protein
MPYFIYKIHAPIGNLEHVAQHATFKDASMQAKALRTASDLPAGCMIKVIFAENQLHAEDLLSQVREPEPMIGDDY